MSPSNFLAPLAYLSLFAAGTFSVHGLNCIACPPGFYSAEAGQMQCMFCPDSETTKHMKGQAACRNINNAVNAVAIARTPIDPYGIEVGCVCVG
jgi:hypothetical protein